MGKTVCTILLSCFLLMARPSFGVDCNWRSLTAQDTFDLYLADKIVGTLVHTVEYNEISATTLVSTEMAVAMGGIGSTLGIKEKRRYNILGSMVSAYQEISGPSGVNSWALKKNFDQWDFLVIVGGVKTARKAGAIGDNLSSSCRLIQGIQSLTLKKGDGWCDTTFEMVTGRNVVTKIHCIGVDTVRRIWTIENIDNLTNRTERQEIDRSGSVVEESVAGLYLAKNRDKRLAAVPAASAGGQRQGPRDPLAPFSIPSDRAQAPGEDIAVTGDDSSLTMDSSVAQWYVHAGRRWVLGHFPAQCDSQANLPQRQQVSQWLRPTISMQCDNQKIRELSIKLRGNEKDVCGVAASFTRYVFTTLQKRNTATFSNALETLNAGYGDCGEHATLLGALLRAAGVPARVVLGLVYVESKKAYGYHAWVMARAGEWVFADAALGIFPASRNYVPLIIDDTGSNGPLISRMVGRIKIEYVKNEGNR